MNPTLPKEVKAWGEGPLRPKEISRHRDTLGQIRAADNTAGRSATRHLERFRSRLICGIWCTPQPYGHVWHKALFGWDRAQGRAPHAWSLSKIPSAPSAFPLLGAPQAPGNEPNPPEGGKSLGGRPPEAEGNLQAPRHTWPDPCRR